MESGSAHAHASGEALTERLLSGEEASDSLRRRGQSLDSSLRPRLLSLDIVRGLTIAMMLFVNHSGQSPWWIPHAEWDGIHLADFVMPGFLVIMGASVALSLKVQRERGLSTHGLIAKALVRAAKLFVMGLFIQGGVATGRFPSFDLSTLRIMGVLQRISICYLLVSLMAIAILPMRKPDRRTGTQIIDGPTNEAPKGFVSCTPAQIYLWGAAVAILIAYTALSLTIPVPGCRLPALTTACNAAAWIDGKLLRPRHMYPYPTCRAAKPPCAAFDPEGLFTTLGGATSSAAFGLAIGSHFTLDSAPAGRLTAMSGSASVFLAAGLSLHFLGVPLNKNLYSGSFVLTTTSATAAVLAFTYWLADVRGCSIFKSAVQPLVWLGTNPIAIFFGDEVLEMCFPLVFWKTPQNNLRDWSWKVVVSRAFGSSTGGWLVGALIDVGFWMLVARHLYRKRIFFKV